MRPSVILRSNRSSRIGNAHILVGFVDKVDQRVDALGEIVGGGYFDIGAGGGLGGEVSSTFQITGAGLGLHFIGDEDVLTACHQIFFLQAQVGITTGLVKCHLLLSLIISACVYWLLAVNFPAGHSIDPITKLPQEIYLSKSKGILNISKFINYYVNDKINLIRQFVPFGPKMALLKSQLTHKRKYLIVHSAGDLFKPVAELHQTVLDRLVWISFECCRAIIKS